MGSANTGIGVGTRRTANAIDEIGHCPKSNSPVSNGALDLDFRATVPVNRPIVPSPVS